MRYFEKTNGRLSAADIDRVIEETVTEQRLEGLTVTDDEICKLRAYLSGEITKDDYMAWVWESVAV